MSNFQSAANEFLESIDLSPMLEDDLDGELVLEINQNFSLVFGFDQVSETCVLRILFNDLPTDVHVLSELLQNSNTLDVAGYNLSFGIDVGQSTAYGEVRIPDEDIEVGHLKQLFPVFLQVSEWYAEIKGGAATELPSQDHTQMWL
ncbi:hypothetical protein [Pseudovibrio sp. JE062]|uniref:hypothetical protein n=1 Tax=Pseudovibrio sp. JE062 TaxID=439495 RepID=UPI000186C223|nr:hypothetical protein [Pseudovibrio sp. JE062]EEA92763.1 hypothetical protein PJE062_4267 [Pseudovibrio sp. JE062]